MAAGELAATGCKACDTDRKVAHVVGCPRRRSSTEKAGLKRPRADEMEFSAPGPAWSRSDSSALHNELAELKRDNEKVRHTRHGQSCPSCRFPAASPLLPAASR